MNIQYHADTQTWTCDGCMAHNHLIPYLQFIYHIDSDLFEVPYGYFLTTQNFHLYLYRKAQLHLYLQDMR